MSVAAMIIPGVQNPHCRPWCSLNAACTGCRSAPFGKSFNRNDIRAGSLRGEHRAGLHRLAVDMHDAGAALRRVAADMRSRKSQIFPEKMDQKRSVLDVGADASPVHHQRYVGHFPSLGLSALVLALPILHRQTDKQSSCINYHGRKSSLSRHATRRLRPARVGIAGAVSQPRSGKATMRLPWKSVRTTATPCSSK